MRKITIAVFMLLAATTIKAQQIKDSAFYLRKIQPIIIGEDTLNVIAISANPIINLNKNTATVQYAITKQGSQNKIINKVTVPFSSNKELLIKNVVSVLINVKIQ